MRTGTGVSRTGWRAALAAVLVGWLFRPSCRLFAHAPCSPLEMSPSSDALCACVCLPRRAACAKTVRPWRCFLAWVVTTFTHCCLFVPFFAAAAGCAVLMFCLCWVRLVRSRGCPPGGCRVRG